MAKRISREDIIKINELYLEIGVKSRVAKILGISAATVTKYLIEGFQPQDNTFSIKFDGIVPEIDLNLFKDKSDWSRLCLLSEEEKVDLIELRKEILL